MKKFFSLMFALISSSSIYSQIADGSKIYITKNEYYIPGVKEKLIALMYKGDAESEINREDSAYILWLALSNKYDYKIKYSITDQNYLVAFSLYPDSFKVDDRFINPKIPSFAAIKLAELENTQSESIKNFLNNNGITGGPDLQSLSLLDNSPMKQYINEKAKTDLIFYDFASSSKELFLVNKISDTLKIWKYDIEHKDLQIVNNTSSSKPQKISPQLFSIYLWKLNENFYTGYIKNQLFLFTESGYIFQLGSQAKKIGKLSDNLITSAIIVDKDHDKLYLLKKTYLEEKLPFNEILKKYAKEVKLPRK